MPAKGPRRGEALSLRATRSDQRPPPVPPPMPPPVPPPRRARSRSCRWGNSRRRRRCRRCCRFRPSRSCPAAACPAFGTRGSAHRAAAASARARATRGRGRIGGAGAGRAGRARAAAAIRGAGAAAAARGLRQRHARGQREHRRSGEKNTFHPALLGIRREASGGTLLVKPGPQEARSALSNREKKGPRKARPKFREEKPEGLAVRSGEPRTARLL